MTRKYTKDEELELMLSEFFHDEVKKKSKVKLTSDELKKWDDEIQEQKKKRRRWMIPAIVGTCCLLLCFVLPMAIEPSDAEKTEETKVVEQSDTIVIQPEYAEGQVRKKIFRETNWEKVPELASKAEGMMIPGYVPEGYEFKEAVLELNDKDYWIAYHFSNQEKNNLKLSNININGSDAPTTFIEDSDQKIETEKGIVYLQKNNENIIIGNMIYNSDQLVVEGKITEKECKKIIEGFYKTKNK